MEKLLNFLRRFFPCVCCVLLLMSCVFPSASAADYGDSWGDVLHPLVTINSIQIETNDLDPGDTTFILPSFAGDFFSDGYANSFQFVMTGHSSVHYTGTSSILRSAVGESGGYKSASVAVDTILDLSTANVYSVFFNADPFVYQSGFRNDFAPYVSVFGVENTSMPFMVRYSFCVSYPKLNGNRFVMETEYVEVTSSDSSYGEVPVFPLSYDMSRFPSNCLITDLSVQLLTFNYDAGQARLSFSSPVWESGAFLSVSDYLDSLYVDAPIGTGSSLFNLVDFLSVGVGGFLDADLFGDFGIADILGIVLSVAVVILVLRFFAGG